MFNFHTDMFNLLLNKQTKSIEISVSQYFKMNISYLENEVLNFKITEKNFRSDGKVLFGNLLSDNTNLTTGSFTYRNLMYKLKSNLIKFTNLLMKREDERYKSLVTFINLLIYQVINSDNGFSVKSYNKFSIITVWEIDNKKIYNFRFFDNNSYESFKFNTNPEVPIIFNYNREINQFLNNFDKFVIYDSNNEFLSLENTCFLKNKIKDNILYELQ